MPKELTKRDVLEWVEQTQGWFHLRDVYNGVNIESKQGRGNCRTILSRLVTDDRILERSLRQDGWYRLLDREASEIDWQSDKGEFVDLVLPFELHKYVTVRPKSIIIVAGSKSSGKTAFLYETIVLNMGKFPIELLNNETAGAVMRKRFHALDPKIPNPPPFITKWRYDRFADVVDPNKITLIDYMDTNSEFYMIGDEIDKVFRRLDQGVAIIGLQKPPGRDMGYGGYGTAKRAWVYLALDSKRLKIVYAKESAQDSVDPTNMMWSFGFDLKVGTFINRQRYYG